MTDRRRLIFVALLAVVLEMAALRPGNAQPDSAVAHARQVLDLLVHEKFDDVASEFNAAVAGAMSPSQLRSVWSLLREQTGAFGSVIDERVATRPPGITAVTLGCQFEKMALNVFIAFDAERRIAGLRFVPRGGAVNSQPAVPSSSHFKEEDVTVGSGEWALPGTLSMPVDGVVAGVVLVQGSGPEDRDETIGPNKPFRDLAWGLADRGVAVLRYEKRTRQYPGRLAQNRNLTVREETMDDALAAAALLRNHDRIDPQRVIVLGHSLGGTLAPRIAADDHALAGIVILAGATRPLMDAAREQIEYLTGVNGDTDKDKVDAALQQIRRAAPESYWKDLDAYHPAQAAAELKIPMLILQGERDYQVTLADLDGWRKALQGHAGVTIRSYPTVNHLFMEGEGKSTPAEYLQAKHIPAFVLDDIAAWIGRVPRR